MLCLSFERILFLSIKNQGLISMVNKVMGFLEFKNKEFYTHIE